MFKYLTSSYKFYFLIVYANTQYLVSIFFFLQFIVSYSTVFKLT